MAVGLPVCDLHLRLVGNRNGLAFRFDWFWLGSRYNPELNFMLYFYPKRRSRQELIISPLELI